jgi:hypothetical protein
MWWKHISDLRQKIAEENSMVTPSISCGIWKEHNRWITALDSDVVVMTFEAIVSGKLAFNNPLGS